MSRHEPLLQYAKYTGLILSVPLVALLLKRWRQKTIANRSDSTVQSVAVRKEAASGETSVYRNVKFPNELIDNINGMTTIDELWRSVAGVFWSPSFPVHNQSIVTRSKRMNACITEDELRKRKTYSSSFRLQICGENAWRPSVCWSA
jgi:hypothetical protein